MALISISILQNVQLLQVTHVQLLSCSTHQFSPLPLHGLIVHNDFLTSELAMQQNAGVKNARSSFQVEVHHNTTGTE
jgi:hypothetical protein